VGREESGRIEDDRTGAARREEFLTRKKPYRSLVFVLYRARFLSNEELEAEPPKQQPVFLTDLTLDELWEMQDKPIVRARV
jgi:hypothetical protein